MIIYLSRFVHSYFCVCVLSRCESRLIIVLGLLLLYLTNLITFLTMGLPEMMLQLCRHCLLLLVVMVIVVMVKLLLLLHYSEMILLNRLNGIQFFATARIRLLKLLQLLLLVLRRPIITILIQCLKLQLGSMLCRLVVLL